jgi:hypothetical protein
MSVGRPTRLAWSLAGACVALVLGSLALLLAVSHTGEVSQYYYEDAAVALAFALLGAVVAAHRPENPIGRSQADWQGSSSQLASVLPP